MSVVFIMTGIICFCWGCVTKKEVVTEIRTDTIHIESHDTLELLTSKVDTIREYQIVQKTDTIRDVQTRIITLKESGDTIREVINNNLYHYIYQKDSTDKYQNKIDSMQQSINKLEKEKEKILNDSKKVTVKEKSNKFWKYLSCFLCGILSIGVIYIVWLKIKK